MLIPTKILRDTPASISRAANGAPVTTVIFPGGDFFEFILNCNKK